MNQLPTSKAQERETLEKIMDMIQNIGGNDSYIGMAMKGVYEVAISNIENDFGDSLADRANEANSRAVKFASKADAWKKEATEAVKEADTLRQLNCEAQGTVFSLQEELKRLRGEAGAEVDAKRKAESLEGQLHTATLEIIKLKARLYDLMITESA